LESPDAHAALTQLCQTYWYPLYGYVRRHGHSPEDAKDLTQAFFAKLLAKNQIALADRERGRFRTFLLSAMQNFLRTYHRDATALKRGGEQEFISWEAQTAEERYTNEPPDAFSPAMLFEKQWAGTVLETVLAGLRKEFAVNSRLKLFEALEPHLWGDDSSTPYDQVAHELKMRVNAVRVTLHRLRQRFLELLRTEIANTLNDPADMDDELAHLRRVLAA
jgi:RNA polymerase sigma-70 factor (ECF subfamily)